MRELKPWIPKLSGQQILVLGDVILDEYVTGQVTRISREAPVPVLEFESRRLIPGGAANPAANIAALGSKALLCGLTGHDPAATQLRQLLQAHNIETQLLVTDPMRPTSVKMRLMAQMGLRFPQQVARLDTLSRQSVSVSIQQQVQTRIAEHSAQADAILISDYHGGLLSASLIEHLRMTYPHMLITVDAQGELEKYAGLAVVKCNTDDAQHYLQQRLENDMDFGQAAQHLRHTLKLTGAMVITRGPQGATVATAGGGVHHCPAPKVSDVYDVVGAGDTAIAVLTLALAAGAPYDEAVLIANYASGLVVRRVGNYTPQPHELAWALETWGA